MHKFAIAAALTVIATGALAQNAPFYIGADGQMFYPNGAIVWTDGSFQGQASASQSMTETVTFEDGNINWSKNYSGK